MAFLDIEKVINKDFIGSRFKLVHLASLRARELNNPKDDTYMSSYKSEKKVTSIALEDIVCSKVNFNEKEELNENETKQEETNE